MSMNLGRLIYFDADIVILGDLAQLFVIGLRRHVLFVSTTAAGVHSSGHEHARQSLCSRPILPPAVRPFVRVNAAIMV